MARNASARRTGATGKTGRDVTPLADAGRPMQADAHAGKDRAAITTEGQPAPKRRRGRAVLLLILLAALSAGGWFGREYWLVGRFMVTTDDAYLKADSTYVSPKVPGYVARVPVVENQLVRKGDPLVIIDDGDYRIALDSAQARIESQKMTLARIDAQIMAARAQIDQAQAGLQSARAAAENATRARRRADDLFSSGTITSARRDTAVTADRQARAAVASARAQLAAARANVAVLKAQRAEAASRMRGLELARDKAARDLGFTTLRAPFDGQVANLSAHPGDLVGVGQKLALVVPVDRLYITANFKETQMARVVPGEKVAIRVDALPDVAFTGRVASIAPGTGSMFSLLPSDNATGNFTKIVQRVPVRIELTGPRGAFSRLRAGLSVVVKVDSRTAPDIAPSRQDGGATAAPADDRTRGARVSMGN